MNPTFGQRPKRCACLVLRTSVGFKNPTYGLPVCILFFRIGIIPIQKSKLTRRRAADSTDSTARRDNEVRLFFWIGIMRKKGGNCPHLCWCGCAIDVDKPRDVLIAQVKIRLLKI